MRRFCSGHRQTQATHTHRPKTASAQACRSSRDPRWSRGVTSANKRVREDWKKFVHRVITKNRGQYYRRLVMGMPKRFKALRARRGGPIGK